MLKFLCISLLVFSPIYAGQHLIKAAFLMHRQSAASFDSIQSHARTIVTRPIPEPTEDSIMHFNKSMTSILARMEKAGFRESQVLLDCDMQRAFCHESLPLVAAFYQIRGILRELDSLQASLEVQPGIIEQIKLCALAKSRLEGALVRLKTYDSWPEQYEIYLRGVKDGVISRLDEEPAPKKPVDDFDWRLHGVSWRHWAV